MTASEAIHLECPRNRRNGQAGDWTGRLAINITGLHVIRWLAWWPGHLQLDYRRALQIPSRDISIFNWLGDKESPRLSSNPSRSIQNYFFHLLIGNFIWSKICQMIGIQLIMFSSTWNCFTWKCCEYHIPRLDYTLPLESQCQMSRQIYNSITLQRPCTVRIYTNNSEIVRSVIFSIST